MTKRKGGAVPFTPGFFSEPVVAWKQMQFTPSIVVSKRTGRFETDFERVQRIRATGGWDSFPTALPGSLK